jgi:hypothetical protein
MAMKSLYALLLVLLFILVAAVPVYASPPVHSELEVGGDGQIDDLVCPQGFEVWDNLTAELTWTEQYDKNGNWVRTDWHKHGVDRVHREGAAEPVLSGAFNLNCHVVPYTGDLCTAQAPNFCTIENCTGVDWNIQVPGAGTVFHSAGLMNMIDEWTPDWSSETMLAMPKRVGLEEFDVAGLCAALAP